MTTEAEAIAARKREASELTRGIVRVPYTTAGRIAEAREIRRQLQAGGFLQENQT